MAALDWCRLVGLLLLASCYDAPRTNPFDPALTPAVELLSVTVDSTSGSATLEWSPYEGKQPFREYRVLRKVQGLEKVDTVVVVSQVQQTTFRDTTLQPGVVYGYWVEVVNQGEFAMGSEKHTEVVYALPSLELLQADFSSDIAAAQLLWTQYRGPGFALYEIRRRVSELEEKTVGEVENVTDTTYTDSLLDGNTEYTYHIVVRTGWEGVEISSNEKSGKFYPFDHEIRLKEVPGTELRAVALAVDEQDQLYIARTMRETKSRLGSRLMKKGVQVDYPSLARKLLFSEIYPDLESSIHMVAGQGRVYVSVRSGTGKALIAALNASGEEIWSDSVNTEGDAPVGLYLEENGDVLMGDDTSLFYRFGPEGGPPEQGGKILQAVLESFQVQTIGQIAVGPGVGLEGGDHFFFLTPDQRDFHVLGVSRRPEQKWAFRTGTGVVIDKGIGPEKGQTLSPVALVFDSQWQRLLVLEAQGRVQVFDARYAVEQRYITQWGRFGTRDGEFLISHPRGAAMAVDSRGMIYVADGSGRIQVFAP